MPDFAIRWSELEARKPYASPFGVTFIGDDGASIGSIAVNGPDLIYFQQFQQAVLRLGGELFIGADSGADDVQRSWLDRLAARMPVLRLRGLQPESYYDERVSDRRFRFNVDTGSDATCSVDAAALTDYQELQAVVAHHTGQLYRNPAIEAVADNEQRRLAWVQELRTLLRRPSSDDMMHTEWPWH